jgi:hypothetical protein
MDYVAHVLNRKLMRNETKHGLILPTFLATLLSLSRQLFNLSFLRPYTDKTF